MSDPQQRRAPAVDTHAHVFDRAAPAIPGARYRPDHDATLAKWLALQDASGVTHGILVQVSFFGSDNSQLLAALDAAPGRLRATVQVEPDIDSATLRNWHARGVRGVRLNVFHAKQRPDPASAEWRRLFAHLADLGWHVEVHDAGAALAEYLARLEGCPAPLIVDHFGSVDSGAGPDPGFEAMLRVAQRQQVYVKLSGPYRTGSANLCERARILLDRLGPQRLLWGSDWPHTRFENTTSYPETLRRLEDWVPDPAARRAILWDTPARLFNLAALPV